MRIIGLLNLYDSPDLGPLTKNRTLGSTSFLGRYALMDFGLSNFTNSGIDEFSILVKENFRSVSKHVNSLKAWVTNTKIGRQNILINEKGIKDPEFNTDINCIKENDWVFFESRADYVIVQPAHIIALLDFRTILDKHIASGADITVVYKEIDDADKAFIKNETVEINEDGVVTSFGINEGKNKKAKVFLQTFICSIGIMRKIVVAKGNNKSDSLKDAIAKLTHEKDIKVVGYEYKGYCRSFDSFEHFVEYSFELLDMDVAISLFDQKPFTWFTTSHNTPPALYGKSSVVSNSFVANGSHINGTVENSIISRKVYVAKGAVVKNSIILTGTKILENAIIDNAVIDKHSLVSEEAKVIGTKDSKIYVRQGKVVKWK